MSKSLIAILHYNTTHYTNALYEMLKPYEREDYDLVVIDNGSEEGKTSKYTTYKSELNVGYGGGLDMSLQLFNDSDPNKYDSFCLLNSDLTIHGYNFFRVLREQLFSNDEIAIISPCLIQNGNETPWKHMRCWNANELRYVPMLDYQCPLMKRKFTEKVKSFNSKYGWVQDVMSGIICKENNWKIAICDWTPIFHVVNGTVKENPHLSDYNINAHQEMIEYFRIRNLTEISNNMKQEAANYTYEKI